MGNTRWWGGLGFAVRSVREARRTEAVASAAYSEQGILKKLFPRYYPEVQLDYRSEIIANLGFVLKPMMEVVAPAAPPSPVPPTS